MKHRNINQSERFSISGPNIVHEVIEGEVVIVNMNNGFYFSSEKLGCVIWRLIECGTPFGKIVDTLVLRYPDDREEIESSTARIIGELRDEGLIVESASTANSGVPDRLFDDIDAVDFVEPSLHKHKDMQDLLLVDPIHEVEDSGWPHTKNAD